MKALRFKLLVFLLLTVSAGPLSGAEVAVLMSSDAGIYQEVLEGFKEVVVRPTITVQTLADYPNDWSGQLKKLRTVIEPDLVFVIGTPALQAISGKTTSIPVVYAMVFNPFSTTLSLGKNVTGISMHPSPGRVVSLLKELNPKVRRIGTMLDPSRSGPLLAQARLVFERAGLQLVASEIRAPNDIGGVLKSLEQKIDVLWLWPDETFLAPDILQRIFLFSFERKIPVLGLSERHTEMGALLSLSYGSPKEMGRLAGEATNKMLSGERAADIHVAAPQQFKLTVNLKTAETLNLKVPDSIIQRADNRSKVESIAKLTLPPLPAPAIAQLPRYGVGNYWTLRLGDGRTITRQVRSIEGGKYVFEWGPDHWRYVDANLLVTNDTTSDGRDLPSHMRNHPLLVFPLSVNKTWQFEQKIRLGSSTKARRRSRYFYFKVLAVETVSTSADNFAAFKIEEKSEYCYSPVGCEKAVIRHLWYAPEARFVVKTAHVQGQPWSGQEPDYELLAYGLTRPARPNEAPPKPGAQTEAKQSKPTEALKPKEAESITKLSPPPPLPIPAIAQLPRFRVGDYWTLKLRDGRTITRKVRSIERGYYVFDWGPDHWRYIDESLLVKNETTPEGKDLPSRMISQPLLVFPLSVNKTWQFEQKIRLGHSRGSTLVMGRRVRFFNVKVLGVETTATPAGNFATFKIEEKSQLCYGPDDCDKAAIRYLWYAPEARFVVKTAHVQGQPWSGQEPDYELAAYGLR